MNSRKELPGRADVMTKFYCNQWASWSSMPRTMMRYSHTVPILRAIHSDKTATNRIPMATMVGLPIIPITQHRALLEMVAMAGEMVMVDVAEMAASMEVMVEAVVMELVTDPAATAAMPSADMALEGMAETVALAEAMVATAEMVTESVMVEMVAML